MLGASAGAMKKLEVSGRVLLDCDNVLSDFAGHALKEARSDFRFEDIATHDGFVASLPRPDSDRARAIMATPEFWRNLPVIVGGAQLYSELVASDCDVWIVTTPWKHCRGWHDARLDWLKAAFNIEAGKVIFTHDKSLIHADALIDDRPETVTSWAEAWPKGIAYLVDRPWNRNTKWPNRLHVERLP